MPRKNRLSLELRCPRCSSTLVHTRLRTNDRACRHCGYIGSLQEFEVNPDKSKK